MLLHLFKVMVEYPLFYTKIIPFYMKRCTAGRFLAVLVMPYILLNNLPGWYNLNKLWLAG